MEQSIVSSDSHVIEVPDLWEKGMSAAFRERAPKAFFDEKRDAWMFGSAEVQIQAVGGLFMAGQQPENLEKFRKAGFAVPDWPPAAIQRPSGTTRTPTRPATARTRTSTARPIASLLSTQGQPRRTHTTATGGARSSSPAAPLLSISTTRWDSC